MYLTHLSCCRPKQLIAYKASLQTPQLFMVFPWCFCDGSTCVQSLTCDLTVACSDVITPDCVCLRAMWWTTGLCPQLRACLCVCVRALVAGVTRIGYKYSQALLIMNRCTWAFSSPENRRSPEADLALWNISSSCSLAVCLRRPHQKFAWVQCLCHDTKFLFSVCFKHCELCDAFEYHRAEPTPLSFWILQTECLETLCQYCLL